MPADFSRWCSRYGLAMVTAAAAVAVQWLIHPFVGVENHFLLFFVAVTVSAWCGGLGPGLVATVLAGLAPEYYFRGPVYPFTLGGLNEGLRLALFLLEGAVVSVLTSQAQRARRRATEQGEWLRAVLSSMGDAVIASGPDGRVTRINPGAEKLTGWTAAEACGHPLAEVLRLAGEGGPGGLEPAESGAGPDRESRPRAVPDTLLDRRGNRTPVETMTAPIRDERRNARGTLVVFRDVTERRRTETSLRESEARFRQLADAMPQIVWTAGPDGRPDYYNQRWFDFTGLSREETFARAGWWTLLPSEDASRCADAWMEAVRSGKPFQAEGRFPDRAGGWRWFLGRAVPVRGEDGGVRRWYGTCTDIDAQKRSEEELREADRRKDAFLAMLSHELRNPLTPLLNSLHILRFSDLKDPLYLEARGVLERQARQLARLVDDLLDVYGVIHGKIALRREPLDLAGLVRQIVEDNRRTLEARSLTVRLRVPSGPVGVQADRQRLTQVVGNLLQNVTKFTGAGDQVTVRVEAEAERGRAVVSVQDSGVGMATDVLDHAFETFSQGSQDLDRRQGGLGLGLALVKGLVDLHGGQVRASSPGPGKGSEISFWLPLAPPPVPPEASPQKEPGRLPRKSLRILIVEDNPDTGKSLEYLLKRYGHQVELATDGRAGVEAAHVWHPEVVLCDLGLPEMNGYEVAGALRHDPQTASARLIAVSGYGQDEDRRRSRAAGFDLHLTKPVDPARLQQLLTSL